MASTQAQNCQRGIIFLFFLIILFFTIMVIIRTIKKLIDPLEEDAGKYKEGKEGEAKEAPKPKPKGEDSTLNFDDIAKQPPPVAEDDPTPVKVSRKVQEIEVTLFPLLILFPLNLLTGTAYAFLVILFFFNLIPLVLFNVMKLHYSCTESKCVRVVLDNLWLMLLFFTTINCWGATTLQQPYIVVSG